MKCFNNLFVNKPFEYQFNGQRKELSNQTKAAIVVLALCTMIFAPITVFLLAKYAREKKIKELKGHEVQGTPAKVQAVQPKSMPAISKPAPTQEKTQPPPVRDLLPRMKALPATYKMREHVFTPATVEGGRLYYQGDIPVLEINAADPVKAGFAHGYLTGPALEHICKKLSGHMQNPVMSAYLEQIKKNIPEAYLKEMQGIVDGYKKWAGEHAVEANLDLNTLLILHLIPDSYHTPMGGGATACTFIADKDSNGDMVIGRTLDWNSHGIFGTFSLVVVRKYDEKNWTLDITVSGNVGTTTGINQDGLCIAMNICDGEAENLSGAPAVFVNRTMLDTCKTTSDVANKILQAKPMGPYHLMAADKDKAQAFHFFQKQGGGHLVRENKPNKPLVVTNFRCITETKRENDVFCSQKREEKIARVFKERSTSKEKIEKILKSEPINSPITLHAVTMIPGKSLRMAFGNSYAGSTPLQEFDFHSCGFIQGK